MDAIDFGPSPTPAEIKAARCAAKVTQKNAAKLIYRTPRTWRKWEHGEREMPVRDWEFFLQRTAPPKPPPPRVIKKWTDLEYDGALIKITDIDALEIRIKGASLKTRAEIETIWHVAFNSGVKTGLDIVTRCLEEGKGFAHAEEIFRDILYDGGNGPFDWDWEGKEEPFVLDYMREGTEGMKFHDDYDEEEY